MLKSELFSLDSSLPPNELLRRLESDATDWQEARLSQAVRALGMYGFAFQRKNNTFRVRPQIPSGIGRPSPPIYEGFVLPRDTGSRISGIFRLGRLMPTFYAIWAVWCVAVFFMGISTMASSILQGPLVAVTLAAGLTISCAFLVRYALQRTWRSGELARAETRALLRRAAEPSNVPLERPGTAPSTPGERISAGRSAPIRWAAVIPSSEAKTP
jgi:hypothetical protein